MLYFDNPFSDDEIINGSFQEDFDKFINKEKLFQNSRAMEKKLAKLKKLTYHSLGIFLRTLTNIDVEVRQIVFKNFDVQKMHHNLSKIPKIKLKLEKLLMTPQPKNMGGRQLNRYGTSDLVLNKWLQNQEGDIDISEDSVHINDNLNNREMIFEGKDRPTSEISMSARSERLNKSLVFLKSTNELRAVRQDNQMKYNINEDEMAQIKQLDLQSINEIKKILNKAKTSK